MGHFKEAGQALSQALGVAALKSKLTRYLFVKPRINVLHLPQEGAIDFLERPLRAETAQGPRTSIARSETLPPGTWMTTYLKVYPGPITEKVLRALLDYGEDKGMGQWRSGGHGQFAYRLREIDALPEHVARQKDTHEDLFAHIP